MNEKSDVYLRWSAWPAGAFTAAIAMFLLDESGNDVPLMTQCFAGKAHGCLGPGSTAPGWGVSQGTSSGTGSLNAQGLAANQTGTSGGSRIFWSAQPQLFAPEPSTNCSSTTKQPQRFPDLFQIEQRIKKSEAQESEVEVVGGKICMKRMRGFVHPVLIAVSPIDTT